SVACAESLSRPFFRDLPPEDDIEEATMHVGTTQRGPLAAEAHHGVMESVVALEEVLGRSLEPHRDWLEALGHSLDDLIGVLREHFDEESAGELYGELLERFPRYAHRLEQLAAEHEEILQRAEALLESTAALDRDDLQVYRLRELNAQGQLLAAILRRHEAEENEIVMRAYWNEVGTGD
ncbi:MAG: hemerythrin domain-containing protein, partial [Holophagales bacterium]|nr:hemerythrin domain-containing protein [Holophagales bacterium]